MPEISLKDYFAKLNTLLNAHAADEVVHHSRHILESFPKNVTAYRFLGRGLVSMGHWEEGRDALRGVLSVIPDDYAAHLGLSEANERLNRPDEAIWHLERAFEQRPNDKELIDAMRSLYRQHRHVENLKIQLSSAAVARQYMRSGAYPQAIDTLRGALTRAKDRLDLRLLLAQILWQHGAEEESADIALEVLKVLPDCLQANQIMAQLWLSVGRPSDAQRHVNRLEAVDPYLAVELVQGFPADDDVFKLDELDYVRTSQTEMASARPDWLQAISSTPASVGEGEKQFADDPTDWASAMLSSQKPAEPAKAPAAELPEPSTSERFAEIEKNERPVVKGAVITAGLTDLFGKPDEADADELSALFNESDSSNGDDPMAWMHDSGVKMVDDTEDEPTFDNLFGEEDDAPISVNSEDPMAWLQGSNEEMILEDDDGAPQRLDAADDAFAWMQEEKRPAFIPSESRNVDENANAFGWQDEHMLDEALGAEGLSDNGDHAAQSSGGWEEAAFSVAALNGLDEMVDQDQTAADALIDDPSAPTPRRGLTAILDSGNFDWVNKKEVESVVSDDEMDEWLNQFGATPEPRKASSDVPDWISDLEEPETELQADGVFAAEANDESPAWLQDAASDDAVSDVDYDGRLAAFVVPAVAGGGADLTWLTGTEPQETALESEAEDEISVGDVPDWLSEIEPEQAASELQGEPAGAGDLTWLTGDQPQETEAESEAERASDVPDWLSELEPEQEANEPQDDAAADPLTDGDFTWLADSEPQAMEDEPVITDNEFTWMAGAAAAGAVMSNADNEPETEPEAEAASDMPDWLSELQPEQEASDSEDEPIADSEFTWMAGAVAAGAVMSNADNEPEAELSATDDKFTSMMDEALASAEVSGSETLDEETVEPEAVAGEVPDWLSELAPEQMAGGIELEPEADLAADNEFAWMTEEALTSAGVNPVEPDAVVGGVPTWLSDLDSEEDAADAEPAAQEPAAEDDEFAWLDEPETTNEDDSDANWIPVAAGAVAVGAVTDQMDDADEEDSVGDAFDDAFGDDSSAFDADEDEFGALSEDEALEPLPAHNAPDWLNAMVPGLDVDYEATDDDFGDDEFDDEELSSHEDAWLTEMVAEEMAATERPSFAFSHRPAWLGASDSLPQGDDVDDDALPDWPSDDADADVPDWLR